MIYLFFFFNDTATTEIYTLSLHDALPILQPGGDSPRILRRVQIGDLRQPPERHAPFRRDREGRPAVQAVDRKSTRLNSSHSQISYAVFCLKKKKKCNQPTYGAFINKTTNA